jgi:hypothetical protein
MTSGGLEPSADRRAAILIVIAALILAALLQLVVFEQYSEERLATLGVEVILVVVLVWAYSDGYAKAATLWADWKLRRHIRSHPEMVTALEGLLVQVEDTLGPQRDGFRNASLSVLNDWWRVWSATLNTDKPPAFSESDRQRYEAAQRATGFWQTHLGDWPAIRSTANHLLRTSARRDGLSYAYAAYLVRSYIASSIVYIQDFTLNAQQMNVAKIGQINLNDWATYAKKVNALISAAQQIDNLGPSKVGYGLDLKFEPVVENLAMAASINSMGAAVKVTVGPPTVSPAPTASKVESVDPKE